MTSSNDREILRLRIESEISDAIGELPGRSKNVYTALLLDGRRQWRLLLHRSQPAPASRCDGLFLGPRGVFALNIVDELPGAAQIRRLRAQAEQLFAGVTIAPHGNEFVCETVELVFVLPVGRQPATDGRFVVTTDATLRSLLTRDRVMTAAAADALAEHTGRRSTDYQLIPTVVPARAAETDGLLAAADLRADQVTHALSKPFPSWLAFLDPAQNALVSRNYNGPARIVGPAGTGKTVLALHRMAYRSRRSTGPLLYTTLVKNLPPYQKTAFARLSPHTAHRAEFTNLHAWARELLARRRIPVTMDMDQADNAFAKAWSRAGAHGPLAEISVDIRYWREEIDRVIKGRGLGLDDFAHYAGLLRRGRRVALHESSRALVWDLYRQYERLRREARFHDANDVIALALNQLRAEPLERPYAMVVVDEVQDITVQSLRLVHELTGNAADALLLVGDGQQRIYAGGWRLIDAGIRVVGRSETLTKNYRNRRAIVEFAAALPGAASIRDLEPEEGHLLARAEAALPGGRVDHWAGPSDDLPGAVIAQIGRLRAEGVPDEDIAIITMTTLEADRLLLALKRGGIPTQNMEQFHGADDEAGVKVGNVYRAKGLDFRAVIHPFAEPAPPTTDAERERHELTMRQQFVAVTRARDFVWLGVVQGR
ncbi:UvrD-helicase domain-containing protein [Nocardia neocaledoniensis]|uniref:UvrD-helicase domain-containing protein n=1 Tax=Nocardia neocaledoniensis TaxID=236511 RepID=UPI00245608E3|nr:UvrD-helicase domain-containing protein [Nocardia neocaledoniensis]